MTLKEKIKRLKGCNLKTYLFRGDVLCETYSHSLITVFITNDEIPDPDLYFKSSIIIWDREPKCIIYHKALDDDFFRWKNNNRVANDRHKAIFSK